MKTRVSVFLMMAMAIISLAGCSPKASPTVGGQEKVTYTCPMHAEVISDKPGSCPKCGMDLVQSNAKGGHNHKGCKMNHNGNGSNSSSGGGCGMRH
jgi:hypothetical protein